MEIYTGSVLLRATNKLVPVIAFHWKKYWKKYHKSSDYIKSLTTELLLDKGKVMQGKTGDFVQLC